MARRILGATILCLIASTAPAQNADPLSRHRELTVYAGRGVDSNLRQLPSQIINDELPWERTYFAAVGLAHAHKPPQLFDRGLHFLGWDGATTAVEVVVNKHHGLQDVWELGILGLLRSPFAHLGSVRARIGAGIGFSYTFGTPVYEDGSADEPNRRWRFQNYNAFELEMGMAQWPATTLVARVHHRSGLYGLLAPKGVGSNFVAVAVRHQF
jgi:hypothetical protein